MATTASRRPTSPGAPARPGPAGERPARRPTGSDPRYQAFALMRLAFTVAPIAFGLDKFANVLVRLADVPRALDRTTSCPGPGSSSCTSSASSRSSPASSSRSSRATARTSSPAWLAGIIVNLVTASGYYDIALRDFGLLLGALALGRLGLRLRPAPPARRPLTRRPQSRRAAARRS